MCGVALAPLVEDVGDVGEVVGGGEGGAGAALGGGEGAGGGQRGLCGRGVEPAGVKAQPTMPTDNGAVEPVRVAAGVKEASRSASASVSWGSSRAAAVARVAESVSTARRKRA